MPDMELVEVIPSPPGCCLFCGTNPVDETVEGTPPLPMVHLPGMDVNWGDHVTICVHCVGLMADLIDRPAREEVDKVKARIKFEKRRADKATKRNEELEARMKVLVGAKKVVKQVKAGK